MAPAPKFELQANRDWVIENYTEKPAEPLEVTEPKLSHNVCVRDSQKINVVVKKKINNLTLENCTNVNVVVDNVIASIELIRCKKCQVQIMGTCSAATIDTSSGINLYASLDSRSIQITTSQIQEVNIHVPKSREEPDEWLELPIPAQFVHSIPEGADNLNTKVSDLYH